MITSEEMKMDSDDILNRDKEYRTPQPPRDTAGAGTESTKAYQPRLDAFVQRGGIGWAIKQMQYGLKVRRYEWNGRGMWLAIEYPTPSSMMTVPYVYMYTVNRELVPWLCSQTDLLSTDWEIATAD